MTDEMTRIKLLCATHPHTYSGDCVDCAFRKTVAVEHILSLLQDVITALDNS